MGDGSRSEVEMVAGCSGTDERPGKARVRLPQVYPGSPLRRPSQLMGLIGKCEVVCLKFITSINGDLFPT